jgi:hypothetical protein
LGHLARSVSRVTVALSIVSSVSQLFSFLVGCSEMIVKGPGLGHLARSVSRVTVALSIVSSFSQLFSFLVGCSEMIVKEPGLGHLARSVSKVTVALSIVSSFSQLFSFLVGCSEMVVKGSGFVAFFAGVKASSFSIQLSCLVCCLSVFRGEWSYNDVISVIYLNLNGWIYTLLLRQLFGDVID